jgi:CRP-like cAMP-binding protein
MGVAPVASLPGFPPALLDAAREVRARAGQTIFRRGSRPRYVLYVVSGDVRLVRVSRSGTVAVLQRADRGFVAEASIESGSYHCDIVAAAPSRLAGFPVDRFRDCLAADRRFRAFWMSHLAGELRRLRARCERLVLRGATERIEHYVETEGRDGRIALRQTRKAWAAELGLSHEALYRALSALQRAGRILAREHDGHEVIELVR